MPAPRAEVPRISRTRAERLARQRALAHWIERAVEDGRVGSYGEVARALGLTESRITQVTALLGLPPAVQEAVLLGEGGVGIREAIRAAREVEWPEQLPLPGAPRQRAALRMMEFKCGCPVSAPTVGLLRQRAPVQ